MCVLLCTPLPVGGGDPVNYCIIVSLQLEVEDESFAQDTPGIIILHPGSSTLRLSLSNQLDPFYIPHLIAYRKIQSVNNPSSSAEVASDGIKILKSNNIITVS